MNTNHSHLRSAAIALLLSPFAVGIIATPAQADDTTVIASDASTIAVVAADRSPAKPAHRGASATASIPDGIVVTGHGGYPVSVTAPGEPTLRVSRPGNAPARFTGLTPGTTYTVAVNEHPVTKVTAVSRPRPASGLTVRTTGTPGTVKLTWKHATSRTTGGSSVDYTVTAKPTTGPAITTTVRGRTSATLTGLDQHALYTFSVTPRNSAGSGKSTTAVMTRTLASTGSGTTGAAIPVNPPATPPTEQPKQSVEPAKPTTPAMRTIYVCAEGFVEANGLCHAYLPYTFDTKAYTFHDVATGPEPLIAQQETTAYGCPAGWKFEDYGWIRYCRLWGPAPTISVKDATPTGYADNGTEWIRKAPAPAGYLDNGTSWERTVPLEARVVPA